MSVDRVELNKLKVRREFLFGELKREYDKEGGLHFDVMVLVNLYCEHQCVIESEFSARATEIEELDQRIEELQQEVFLPKWRAAHLIMKNLMQSGRMKTDEQFEKAAKFLTLVEEKLKKDEVHQGEEKERPEIESNKRFLVALSFPGEHREFVADVAQHLSRELGQPRVLYDRFHEAEFARPNLDTHLQALYHDESELVVVFLSANYERKEWPGLEWRAIRDLIKKKQAPSIMLIRLDDANVSGVFSIDGYINAEGRTPADIAALIIDRLLILETERQPLGPSQGSAQPATGSIPAQGQEHASNTLSLDKNSKIPQPIRDVIKRGVEFLNSGHFEKAKAEFQQAVTLAEEANHSLAIVDAKEHLALVMIHFDRDVAGAKALLQSCLDILATEDNDEERADVLDRFALAHEQEGDLEMSESLQRQSLAISERRADKLAQAGTLVNLGWTVGRRGRTDEALDLNRKAYDLLTQVLHEAKHHDTREIDFIHTVFGNLFFQRAKIHQRRAEPDDAEKALETALEWQRKVEPSHELAKLLCELARLKFFKQEWNEGASLLQEAARFYQEREMLPEFAKCLHMMGRVYASIGNLEKAGEFFSDAAAAASQSGRSQEAAEVLLSLAHLAVEQRDVNAARQLFENAKAASDDGEFQAKCLMDLSRLAGKEGHEDERRRLVEAAVDLLKAELANTKPEMERAHQYFTLGWYLREAGQVEEALSCVRKARERFEAANDAYGAAKASFEVAGLLDHMNRKEEAREMCLVVLKMIEGKPFFEIAAAVDLSLAKFALHDDKNLSEADQFLEHAIELCKKHDLPLLPDALLLKDELENVKRAGTEAAASIPDLLDNLHQELALCPANRDGYVRLWAFCHARKIGSALRGTLGPNVAILTNDLADFLQLSVALKPYRDWSLIAPPQKYPENIFETIPFAENMKFPADGVALLGLRRTGTASSSTDLRESSDPAKFWEQAHASPEVRAEIAVSRYSTGGTIARYFIVSLEG